MTNNIVKIACYAGIAVVASTIFGYAATLVALEYVKRNHPELHQLYMSVKEITDMPAEQREALARENDERLEELLASLTEDEQAQIEQLNKELAQ